ncbi:hypothetical protein QA089_004681 [Meyerozyma guilliermondii]
MESNGPPQSQDHGGETLSSNLPSGYDPDEPEIPVSRQLTMRREDSLAEAIPSGYAEDDTQPPVLRQRSGRNSSLSASLPDGYYDESDKASPIQMLFLVEPGFKTWLNILNGSIWGVLARRGLEALTTYNGSYLSGVVWANFAACVVMGMLVESHELWKITESELQSVKASLPLYVGAATGFCGTLSSFSSFILEMFYKSTNTEPTNFSYPNRAYGIMEFLAVGIVQVTVSLGGFYLGSDMLRFSDRRFPSMSLKTYQVLEWVSMVVGVVAYIVTIVLIAVKKSGSWRSWMFSVLFAPFGAWGRFYVSRWFNTRIKGFPLGTFIIFMYIPKKYAETDWEKQADLIVNYPLGTVVTSGDQGLIANHIPFYLYTDSETGKSYLRAHVAKVNHQVPSLKENDNVMVIFQSADSYISPSHYPGKQETHKYVPTWDFAAVHVYGKSRIIDDGKWVRSQLDSFTAQNETKRAVPWKVSDAPESYTSVLIKAITGLEIEIDRTECKFKFEQEKSRKDIDGVIEGLEKENPVVSEMVREANKVKS